MMAINYDFLRKNCSYEVHQEGLDWIAIRNRGKIIHVSRSFLVEDPISETYNLKKDVNTVVNNEEEDLLFFGGIYD